MIAVSLHLPSRRTTEESADPRRLQRDAEKALKRGEYEKARERFAQIVSLLEQSGADDRTVLKARADLLFASGLSDTDKAAYRDEAHRLAEDSERVLGPDDPETLMARANLASGYQGCGEYETALELAKRVLADYERVLGPENSYVMTASLRVGTIATRLGDTATARLMLDRALILAELLRSQPGIEAAKKAQATLYASGNSP